MYASPSARCQASSPSERPPASGRKSYWLTGSARKSLSVFSASYSHEFRNISSSFVGMVYLLARRTTFVGLRAQASRHQGCLRREARGFRASDQSRSGRIVLHRKSYSRPDTFGTAVTVVIAGVATTGCAVSISDVFGRSSTCAYADVIVLKSNEAILRREFVPRDPCRTNQR